MAPSKRKVTRRQALTETAKAAGVACLGGFSLAAFIKSADPVDARALRPPGALSEAAFQVACVHCGLCVEACPYGTLSLAEWGEGAPLGTPFFTARETPCYMCKDIPCAKACPTGALDRDLPSIRDANMGVAVLVGHETCLNYKGLNCSICVRVCPIRGEAISLEDQEINGRKLKIPVVHSDKCTGCGTCEKQCVLGHAAIRVLPRDLGLGGKGRNRAGRNF
ncbi:ferredoxin-type protein NapG [Paracoccus aminophilus]|uniref:Methylamine utilization ferredoxin-type protein MauM n=1 Tax=Paracoccus aminophilus JCM 7686 TaxID=1367847 RepID=S5YPP1_PARAH|nr:ferredoxin-type protein NapG [Paracoccus aminophilus]AGT07281.1 methylamine utilization ferredoxin-type protein MauM [Paracoccus aminophilus JCM 7686]